jgi:hypothetical protein
MANAPAKVGPNVPSTPEQILLQQFLKRQKKAQGVAYLWASLLEACYYYAVPQRNRYWRPKQQQGESKGTRIYDTTAVEATKTFVSKLHDAMTPPGVQWGFLMLDGEWTTADVMEVEEAQGALDQYMRKLFNYIHASNFDVAINECYFDLAIGTSCLIVNQNNDKNPLVFTSVPMDILSIEEAMTGRVESWYRTWEDVKINEITQRWPKAVITAQMEADMLQDRDSIISKIYEGVMYKPEVEDKPYCYMVTTDQDILFCEYLESNPGIVWRFQKTNNETWGRGPVMDALPSIISLQEMARVELASANLNTFRPYMGFSDSVFNPHTFKLEPFTIIPIAPIGSGGQLPLVPLPESANPQFAQLTINDLRYQIRQLLFTDQLMQASTTGRESIQPTTATEQMVNKQELAERIGPLFSRLQQEFLEPLIMRVSYILDKMGLLPRPKIDGKLVTFKYKSPLALAKGQQEIARLTQYIQLIQGMFGPDKAMLYINPEVAPWVIAEQMQIDKRYLNSPDGVKDTSQAMLNHQEEVNEGLMGGQENPTPTA